MSDGDGKSSTIVIRIFDGARRPISRAIIRTHYTLAIGLSGIDRPGAAVAISRLSICSLSGSNCNFTQAALISSA
jgi:hypothetical protein